MSIPELPHKCFVSHSYQDEAARVALLATLPPSVEPFIFPAITVMLAVLSFNFIGDALRDYLDPRARIQAGL